MVSTHGDRRGGYVLMGLCRNESFAFAAAPATQPKMFVWVYDHKTLGKDKLLGSADIDVRLRCPNLATCVY